MSLHYKSKLQFQSKLIGCQLEIVFITFRVSPRLPDISKVHMDNANMTAVITRFRKTKRRRELTYDVDMKGGVAGL